MIPNIFDPVEFLGPLKIYGTSRPNTFVGERTGWFYPLYTTRGEAIQADIDRGGKGIYRTLTFFARQGEFYIPAGFINAGQQIDPLIYTKYDGDGAENPFERIQYRLSLLIENQLPDVISENYTNFVKFLKAYYEFLEQNNGAQEVLQNIQKYSDIDTTAQELVTKFLENYAPDLTQSEFADNRKLIKNIREIYSKKGTETAYRLMFTILYKEAITFFYPWDIVLKASSGNWVTEYSLRIRQTNLRQNIYDFENTEILGKTSGATAIVRKVIKVSLGKYEVYDLLLDATSLRGRFTRDEEIFTNKTILLTGSTFSISPLSARVYSVISDIDIVDGGLGYAKGTPIEIVDPRGEGILAKAKVNGVNRYGTITNFNVVEAGVNYSANTYINIGFPTETITGTYRLRKNSVTVTFNKQHGLTKGKNISVYYSGNVFSPIDNTSHTATVTFVPNPRQITFKYPSA